MSASIRSACRASTLVLPLRRPTHRAPRTHPTTGLPLSRAKGQHIIHNIGVVQKILEAADIRSFDSVYEVGCGTGNLTIKLLEVARCVHTVDVEPRMVSETQHRADAAGLGHQLHTQVGDALKIPMPRRFDICVSNLPYHISSRFIFQLLRQLSGGRSGGAGDGATVTASPAWRCAVLMLQREFAERLLADPGERGFSRLAISVRLFARAYRLFDVKPGSFIPEPQVHSTVVRLVPRVPQPVFDYDEWDALVRIIFSRRRRTIRAQFKRISVLIMLEFNYHMRCSMMGLAPKPCPFPELVQGVVEQQGIGAQRGFCLDIDAIYRLLLAFHRQGIYFASVHDAAPAALLSDDEEEAEESGDQRASAGLRKDGTRRTKSRKSAVMNGRFSPRPPLIGPFGRAPPPPRSAPGGSSGGNGGGLGWYPGLHGSSESWDMPYL